MNNIRLIYTNEEGGVSIVQAVPGYAGSIDALAAVSVPEGTSYRVINISKLPSDRYFRDAWTDANDTDTVDVDLSLAREIQKVKLRNLRKEKFEKLDVSYIRAIEAGDTLKQQAMASRKQILRNVTDKCDNQSITNLDTLKNVGISDIDNILDGVN